MTLEEQIQQYDDEIFAAEGAAEDEEMLHTDDFLCLYGSDFLTICDINEELNTTPNPTPQPTKDPTPNLTPNLTPQPTEPPQYSASTPICIIDSSATTIIITDIPNIIKNTTTVHTTDTVHTIDTINTNTNKVIAQEKIPT